MLEKNGWLIAVDDFSKDDEGEIKRSYAVMRLKDNRLMQKFDVTMEVYNGPLTVMSDRDGLMHYTTVSGENTGRKLLGTFFDDRPLSAKVGGFTAKIDWDDGQVTNGEIVVSGNRRNVIQVFGSHTYSIGSDRVNLRQPEITLMESNGGQWAPGSKFCKTTHKILDANYDYQEVGGMAVTYAGFVVLPNEWQKWFGAATQQTGQAMLDSFLAFTRDKKDAARDSWRKLSDDATANQKLLVQTVAAVLRQTPTASSANWQSIMADTLKRMPSQPGHSINQIAFDVALGKLVGTIRQKLAGLNVKINGITDFDIRKGVSGLTAEAQKLALPLAKSIPDSTLLSRILAVNLKKVNPVYVPGKPIDNGTLCAANLDDLLKNRIGMALSAEKAGIANWQSLEGFFSQRLGRTVKFGPEQSGKETAATLAALKDGSTGVLRCLPKGTDELGYLVNVIKVKGKVYLLDGKFGRMTTLNLSRSFRFINTTV